MRDYMIRRVLMCAEYILETGTTVRDCADKFGTSKSTVHKDVSERLQEIDFDLYCKVREVLDKNLKERHIRGGNATKLKYEKKTKKSKQFVAQR